MMANPFTQLGLQLYGRLRPGQNSPFSGRTPRPYEKLPKGGRLGPPTDEELRKQGIKRKRKRREAVPTS